MSDERDRQAEDNVADDESFAIARARLDGTIHGYSAKCIAPGREILLQEFRFGSHSQAYVMVGTNADRGKNSETLISLHLEQGWFVVQVDDTTIDVNNRGRGCILTIRAQGGDEAINLARLLELAGVTLRRQIEESLRGY